MSNRKLLQKAIGLALVALLLANCGGPQAGRTVTPTVIPRTATPTPVPPTPTPTPIPPTSTPTPVPPTPTRTPIPTTGIVEGILVQTDTQRTLTDYSVRLFRAVLITETAQVAIPLYGTVDEEPVSETVTDKMGRFIFEEIEPGSYVLVSEIVRPMISWDRNIVSNDGKVIAEVWLGSTPDGVFAGLVDANRISLIEVEAGQVVDLGEVAIEDTSR